MQVFLRPLLLFALSYAGGIFASKEGYSNLFIIAGVLALLFLVINKLFINKRSGFLVLALSIVFFLLGQSAFIQRSLLYRQIGDRYDQKYVSVTGVIYKVFSEEDGKKTFYVKTREIKYIDTVFKEEIKIKLTTDDKNVQKYKDLVLFEGFIKRPKSAENKGLFDERVYLATKEIPLTIFSDEVKVLGNEAKNTNVFDLAFKLNSYMKAQIEKHIKGEAQQFVKGIILGDKSGFTEETLGAVRRAGVSHIICVSGMHISIIINFLFLVLTLLKIRRKSALMLALFVGIAFVFVVGCPPSAVRAAAISFLSIFAKYIFKKADGLNNLGFASLFLLMLNPYTLFDMGFLLSVLSTATIMIYTEPMTKRLSLFPKGVRDIFSVTISAQIGTLPVIASSFHYFSLFSISLNVIVVPIASIILVLSFIFVLLSGFLNAVPALLAWVIEILSRFILFMVDFVSKINFGLLHLKSFGIFELLLWFTLSVLFYLLLKGCDED